jgi:hypothetical protein
MSIVPVRIEDVRPYLLDICPTAFLAHEKMRSDICFRRLIRTICCPAARHMSGSKGQEDLLRTCCGAGRGGFGRARSPV